MDPAQAPVKRQCLPPKLCTKCNFCRKIQFKGSATMRRAREQKAPFSCSSRAHKANFYTLFIKNGRSWDNFTHSLKEGRTAVDWLNSWRGRQDSSEIAPRLHEAQQGEGLRCEPMQKSHATGTLVDWVRFSYPGTGHPKGSKVSEPNRITRPPEGGSL